MRALFGNFSLSCPPLSVACDDDCDDFDDFDDVGDFDHDH